MARVRSNSASWDYGLVGAALALSCVSLIALRSAAATLNPMLMWKQALWVAIGLAAYGLMTTVSYTRWLDLSVIGYVAVVVLLAVVELAGTIKLGAARWLTIFGFSLQPSEFAKLTCACVVARYVADQPRPLSGRALVVSAVIVGVPALLVFAQPDLGSSSILVAIWLGVVWVGGISRRQLTVLAMAGLMAMPVAWHVLKAYQRARLLVFLNPQADPLGAGYTIIQSEIAIGSGRWWGRGWMAGTQSQLNFLPERHADFLYSVIGEEWGWVGAVTVLVLFGWLLWRAVRIALDHSEPHGRLLATALASWIGYQMLVNVGMVMGVVPVVGVPLPLLSYGGSAMVVTWMAVGLLQSIHRFGTRW